MISPMLPSEHREFRRRLIRLRPLLSGKDADAKRLVLTVLHLLAKHRFPVLSSRLRISASPLQGAAEVADLVKWFLTMDALDLAFWLSSLYASLVSESTRKTRALFFTPPRLSTRMIANLQAAGADFATARVIDPACGGAAFLGPVARAIRAALVRQGRRHHLLSHLQTHLTGWDLDPVLCTLAQAFVWMAIYEDIEAAGKAPALEIRRIDALKQSLSKTDRYDIVICNPPYRKVSAPELETLAPPHRTMCSGQPNLYAIFMGIAQKLAGARGRLALLTPTSFLSGSSFSPLRRRLATAVRVVQIDLVDQRQGVFVAVEQETAVTTLCGVSALDDGQHTDTRIFVVSEKDPAFVGSAALPTNGSPWILPRRREDAALLSLFREPRHTLASYGYETRIGVFVPHRDKRPTSRRRGVRRNTFPLIWSTDIDQNGRLTFETNTHAKRFLTVPDSSLRIVHRRPCVALQRTTSKDDRRRLVAAPIGESLIRKYGGYAGENHVVFLIKTDRAACGVQLLARLLRSSTVDRLFRCVSGSVAVSSSELAELPLPDPSILIAAVARGAGIEAAVAEGFGLTLNHGCSPTEPGVSDESLEHSSLAQSSA